MHRHLAIVALLLVSSACRVQNPKWVDHVEPLGEERVQLVRESSKAAGKSRVAWSHFWEGLEQEERDLLAKLENDHPESMNEFLYEPELPERWRFHVLDKLRVLRVYPKGDTDPGEIEPFKNGDLDVSLTALGGDWMPFHLVKDATDEAARRGDWLKGMTPRAIGVNVNAGFSTVSAGDGDVLLLIASAALVFDYDFFAIEAGHIWGYSPDESLDTTQDDQDAWYVGLRLDLDTARDFGRALWDRITG